ncbi:MAG TPA: Bax inhibitor-1/YccA family protein, partial [Ilumatobacteraceae bacterium]
NFKETADNGMAAGWAAPQSRSTPLFGTGNGTQISGLINDGPVSTWQSQTMTVQGTATATGVLFVFLLAAATLGWSLVKTQAGEVTKFPAWTIAGILVGLGCVIAVRFKPQFAKVLGPIYAIAEGIFIGAISHAYNEYYKGIVIQAVGATIAVFGVMLFLYHTRIIKVTERFRRIVIGATLGVMLFYGISFLINLFGVNVPFLSASDNSPLSIIFSFFVAGLAAFNLALNFDFIERGSKANLPKQMEWVAAIGLMVTIIWLYLEILRLLAKLQKR